MPVRFIRRGVLTKNWKKKYLPFLIPITAYAVGSYVERTQEKYADSWHNKSMLYGGRDLKPGERLWE